MNLTVLGTGYVGVVSAAVFARLGHDVWGLDIDPKRVEMLKNGKSPIYEPGLEDLLKEGIANKKLHFTTSYKEALENTDVIFICVGTPQSESGEVELKYVKAATKSIAENLKNPSIIVLKSTVPPGIQNELKKILDEHTKVDYEFASMPEFLREGTAVDDTLKPDRVVIGTGSDKAKQILLDIHKDLPGKRLTTNIITAQMIKYTANSFLATKISFANAISRICDLVGADAPTVMEGIGQDHRIANTFLSCGLGFGGSCFPKDIKGLYYLAKQAGYDFKLMEAVDEINHDQVQYYLQKAEQAIKSFQDKNVGILGLAFKPNTDDMRDARSIPLINSLLAKGAKVKAYDPIATETAKQVYKDKITYEKSWQDAVKDVDIVFLVTEWDEFKKIDLKQLKELMKGKILVDGRNLFDPQKAKQSGLEYIAVGRK
jgi:UDPglucose 6-dehydrogenase